MRDFSALQIGMAVLSTGLFQLSAIPVYTFLAKRVDLRWLMMFRLACSRQSVVLLADHQDGAGASCCLPRRCADSPQQFGSRGDHARAWQPRARAPEARVRPVQPDAQSRRRDRHRSLRHDPETIVPTCISRLAEHRTTANPAVTEPLQRITSSSTASAGDDLQQGHATALQLLHALVWREAQTQTFADAFLAVMVCLAIATVMVPLMRKVVPPKAPAAEAH